MYYVTISDAYPAVVIFKKSPDPSETTGLYWKPATSWLQSYSLWKNMQLKTVIGFKSSLWWCIYVLGRNNLYDLRASGRQQPA